MLDLQLQERVEIGDLAQLRQADVGGRHAQDLRRRPVLVTHPEHADRPAPDEAAGKGRLANQHQGVEGILLLGPRAVDEAVVGRILGGGEQRPVQPEPAGAVIEHVLVASSLGDLDRDVELHDHAPLQDSNATPSCSHR
jgi:hypothetical protein